jgi:hypothetical protein
LDKHLHIVSFAVPYPVIHGGLFDLYYKLIALHGAGVKIHLHCFAHKPVREPELEKYCSSVNYYPRKTGLRGASPSVPYIVSSRTNADLKRELLKDDHPILLEGIHCTHLLNDAAFASRRMILRLHNVEHQYYYRLYLNSSSLLKKMYYLFESRLLKKYESRIANKPNLILTVSEADKTFYREQFGVTKIEFLPVFTGFNKISVPSGLGSFCLYHGNLSVPENEKVVLWLLADVFNREKLPVIIAGRLPSSRLVKAVARFDNVKLIANPGNDRMQDLIKNAQCHILPSFNATGVKLKLINALYNGRHCIVNAAGAAGSGMENL